MASLRPDALAWTNAFRDWYAEDIPVKKFLGISREPKVSFDEYAIFLVINLGRGWKNWAKKSPTNKFQEQIKKFDAIVDSAHNGFPMNEMLNFLRDVEPDINQWGSAVRKNTIMDLKEKKKI